MTVPAESGGVDGVPFAAAWGDSLGEGSSVAISSAGWGLPSRALGSGPEDLVVFSSGPEKVGSEAVGFEGSSGGTAIRDPPHLAAQLQAPVVVSKSHPAVVSQHVATPLSH